MKEHHACWWFRWVPIERSLDQYRLIHDGGSGPSTGFFSSSINWQLSAGPAQTRSNRLYQGGVGSYLPPTLTDRRVACASNVATGMHG